MSVISQFPHSSGIKAENLEMYVDYLMMGMVSRCALNGVEQTVTNGNCGFLTNADLSVGDIIVQYVNPGFDVYKIKKLYGPLATDGSSQLVLMPRAFTTNGCAGTADYKVADGLIVATYTVTEWVKSSFSERRTFVGSNYKGTFIGSVG